MVSTSQIVVTVTPEQEEADLHPLEARRNAIRERCVLLKHRSLQLGSAIEEAMSAIRHLRKTNGPQSPSNLVQLAFGGQCRSMHNGAPDPSHLRPSGRSQVL